MHRLQGRVRLMVDPQEALPEPQRRPEVPLRRLRRHLQPAEELRPAFRHPPDGQPRLPGLVLSCLASHKPRFHSRWFLGLYPRLVDKSKQI